MTADPRTPRRPAACRPTGQQIAEVRRWRTRHGVSTSKGHPDETLRTPCGSGMAVRPGPRRGLRLRRSGGRRPSDRHRAGRPAGGGLGVELSALPDRAARRSGPAVHRREDRRHQDREGRSPARRPRSWTWPAGSPPAPSRGCSAWRSIRPMPTTAGSWCITPTAAAHDGLGLPLAADDADRADPASETVLLTVEQPFENHNGGQIVFGPDGMLYIGLGDGGGGGDPGGRGQSLTDLLGAILRVDVRSGTGYTVPADNPFAGRPDARGEIWSWASAIHGASRSTGPRAISTSPTWDRTRGRRSMS